MDDESCVMLRYDDDGAVNEEEDDNNLTSSTCRTYIYIFRIFLFRTHTHTHRSPFFWENITLEGNAFSSFPLIYCILEVIYFICNNSPETTFYYDIL